jgi:hypothetical protein
MATANLALEEINASNYITPTPINLNFAKVDKLAVDYIVEQGVAGEWWYRKWNSGIMECAIFDKRFDNIDRKDTWGAAFRTGAISFGAYPFAFVSRPFVSISQNSIDGGHLGGYIFYESNDSLTMSPNFRSVDSVSSTMGHPHFGIDVKGRYK